MDKANQGERFIFVGGAPRSGTTLVQNILDSHPDICGIPEFQHLPGIISLRERMHRDIKRGMMDSICSYGDVDKYICGLILNFFNPLLDKYKTKLLSEKTPQDILVFPQLIALFPRARFIFVVRDPRGIIASMLEVGRRAQQKGIEPPDFTRGIKEAIKFTDKCFTCGFKAGSMFPERVLTITYERLVTDTEAVTRKICQFLDIEWSARMMRSGEIKHLGESSITCEHNSHWYDKKMFKRNPDGNSLYKWQQILTPAEQLKISQAFKSCSELSELGYDFSLGHLSYAHRLQGKLILLMKFLLNRFRRLAAYFVRRVAEAWT